MKVKKEVETGRTGKSGWNRGGKRETTGKMVYERGRKLG